MRGLRITVLLVVFAATAAAVAGIRAEQRRCLARIHELKMEQGRLRQQILDEELGIARLRSPQLIKGRVEHMDLVILSPRQLLNDLTPGHDAVAMLNDWNYKRDDGTE